MNSQAFTCCWRKAVSLSPERGLSTAERDGRMKLSAMSWLIVDKHIQTTSHANVAHMTLRHRPGDTCCAPEEVGNASTVAGTSWYSRSSASGAGWGATGSTRDGTYGACTLALQDAAGCVLMPAEVPARTWQRCWAGATSRIPKFAAPRWRRLCWSRRTRRPPGCRLGRTPKWSSGRVTRRPNVPIRLLSAWIASTPREIWSMRFRLRHQQRPSATYLDLRAWFAEYDRRGVVEAGITQVKTMFPSSAERVSDG